MLPDNWLQAELSTLAALSPLQEIQADFLTRRDLRLFVKRDDLLHPLVGGNKLYKLHGHLRQAHPDQVLASFGGAYSNHLLALAAAGRMVGVPTLGIVRGEKAANLSPTLRDAMALGMRLEFVSRQDYRRRSDQEFARKIEARIGPCGWIPEGGGGRVGAQGLMVLAKTIFTQMPVPPTAVFHACGTGTSVAGLAAGFDGKSEVWGIPVLKAYDSLVAAVRDTAASLGAKNTRWRLVDDYHWGGYAKYPSALADFVQAFEIAHAMPLDPVYTSKVMWAIVDLIGRDAFSSGDVLLMVHSGGLQGRRGYDLDFELPLEQWSSA